MLSSRDLLGPRMNIFLHGVLLAASLSLGLGLAGMAHGRGLAQNDMRQADSFTRMARPVGSSGSRAAGSSSGSATPDFDPVPEPELDGDSDLDEAPASRSAPSSAPDMGVGPLPDSGSIQPATSGFSRTGSTQSAGDSVRLRPLPVGGGGSEAFPTGFELTAPRGVADLGSASSPGTSVTQVSDAMLEADSINHLMVSAIELVNQDVLEEAIRRFRVVLKRDPNNLVARNNLAVCLKRLGKNDQAIDELKKAAEQSPKQAEVHNNLALAYLATGDFDAALDSCYKALHFKPDFAEAQFNLGHLLAWRGDHAGAVNAYQEAIKLSPRNWQYYRDLGDSLRELERFDEALVQYKTAQGLGDASSELLYRMAKCEEGSGNLEAARKALNELVDSSPSNTEYLNALGVVLWKMKHMPESVFVLEKAIKTDPTYYRARNNLGIVLYELKRYEDAVGVWRQALVLKPDYAPAHYNLGTALYQSGLYKQAADAFRKSLTVKPSDAFVHNNLGLALLKSGDSEEAIRQWKEAIRLNPDLAQAYINIGKALQARSGQAKDELPAKVGVEPRPDS